MATALLVLHLMIAAALVAVVLMQRSEGGALGIGGGGGAGGGFLTGRGTANLLTRTTAALAAAFFATSILLTLIAQRTAPSQSIFEGNQPGAATAPVADGATAPGKSDEPAAPSSGGGILDKLQEGQGVPQSR